VELIPITKSLPRTICKKVVKRSLPPVCLSTPESLDIWALNSISIPNRLLIQNQALAALGPFERLCFLTSVPELCVLIVGSQAGRVALMTCTRPDVFSIHGGPIVTFRLDLILPGKKQEDEGMKPNLPLFGLAAAPLQMKNGIGKPGIWRLILHYYDHTVLSYELSRDEATNELYVDFLRIIVFLMDEC
jgi:hypothetical protein